MASKTSSGTNAVGHLPEDQLHFSVSKVPNAEDFLENYAMSTQHDVFVLLWIITAGLIGFLLVEKICKMIERVWKR